MRLYNPTSCTPILAQSHPQWSPPKTYLPKVTESSEAGTDALDFALDSPRAVCGGHSNVASQRSQNEGVHSVGLFPSKARILQEEDVHGEHDGMSIATSSTLSTHTTLQHRGHPMGSAKGAAYGICAPFPASASRSAKSKFLSPVKSGSVILIQSQPQSQSGDHECSGYCRPEDSDHPDDEDSFKVVRSTRTASQTARPTARLPSHAEFATRGCSVQGDRPSCSVVHDRVFRQGTSDRHPCPQLSLTDVSDDMSWCDFSQDAVENPFHEGSDGENAPRKNRKHVFAPIEKAPVSNRRRPLMTIKPRPMTPKIHLDRREDAKRFPAATDKKKVKFPVQSIKQHRVASKGVNDTGRQRNAMSKHMLKAPQFDTPRITPQTSGSSISSKNVSKAGNLDRDSNPDYSKYAEMFRSGIIQDCVRQAMEADGIERSIIDLVLLAATSR